MGLENAVFCRICGNKYFPVSLPFHLKVCTYLFKLTHTDCPLCKRAVFNTDLQSHIEICKKNPNKVNASSSSVVATLNSVSKIMGATDAQGRHPCMICGRMFTQDRIHTHEVVCARR